jgi:hypothetical protein
MEEISQHNINERDLRKANLLGQFFLDLPPLNVRQPFAVDHKILDSLVEAGVTVENLLQEFVRKGFFLHGSGEPNLIALEPRLAADEDDNPDNARNAVYATTDSRIPIFMALVAKLRGRSGYSINRMNVDGESVTESVVFRTNFVIPEDKVGYIYVLPVDTFEPAGGDQFTSPEPVVAYCILPVQLADFQYPIERIEESTL